MQCPHCHAELVGNPVTCPECRQKLRSLSAFNANPPAKSSAAPGQQRGMPSSAARPPRPPRAVPGGIASGTDLQAPPKKKVGLILGLIGLVGWILPIVGIPLSITGLVFACKEKHTPAIVLNSIVLALSLINAIIGAVAAVS